VPSLTRRSPEAHNPTGPHRIASRGLRLPTIRTRGAAALAASPEPSCAAQEDISRGHIMASHALRPHVSRHAPGVLARTVRDGSPRGGPGAGRPCACETADFRGRCTRPPSRSAQPLPPGCWSPPGRLERRRRRSRGCRGRSGSASEPFGSAASRFCSRPTIALQLLDHHGAEAQAPRAVVADVAAEPHADIVRRADLPARKGGAVRRRRRQGRQRLGGRSAPCEALGF